VGKFNKKITVTTNDPQHSKQTLTCKGEILEAVNMNVKRLNFREVSRKSPAKPRKITIRRAHAGPLDLKLRPSRVKGLEATLSELEPGERYELSVTLKPPFDSQSIRTELVLDTGYEKAPTVKIPVYATVIPRVVARPKRINVPPKPPEDWKQIVHLVWDEDDAPYKIVGATSTDPALAVKVAESDNGPQVVFRIIEQRGTKSGKRATVTIQTDDPQIPVVRVPVYFRAARAARKPAGPPRRSAAKRAPKTAPLPAQAATAQPADATPPAVDAVPTKTEGTSPQGQEDKKPATAESAAPSDG